MWRGTVGRTRRRAAGHHNDAIDAEHRGEADRVAKIGVVRLGDFRIGMQRIAGNVEGRDAEAPSGDFVKPRFAALPIREEIVQTAVLRARIPAAPELDVGNRGNVTLQPAKNVVERPCRERIREQRDPQLRRPPLDRLGGAVEPRTRSVTSTTWRRGGPDSPATLATSVSVPARTRSSFGWATVVNAMRLSAVTAAPS